MALSGQQMVNLGLYRYGKPDNDTAARAEFLAYLNLAQRELWVAGDWKFKTEEKALTFVNGTRAYNLDADTAEVFWVANVAGTPPMHYVPPRTFRALYLAGTSGTPTRWTLDGVVVTEGPPLVSQKVLKVWPTPSAGSAGSAAYGREVMLSDIADSATSFSRIPDHYRAGLVAWGLLLMSAQQKNEMVPVYQGEVNAMLDRMRLLEGRGPMVRR